jgi:hypothetical protein
VARLRRRLEARGTHPRKLHEPGFEFLMGPTDAPGEYTAEELEVLWPLHRDKIMAGPQGRHHGTRPWAWWAFEAGEPRPEERWIPSEWGPFGRMEGVGDETVRLAELGELTAEQLAALREGATEAKLRVGTAEERISGGGRNTPGAVSMDAQDVELWERVEAALGKR